jgi:signal transduction histidine kinase
MQFLETFKKLVATVVPVLACRSQAQITTGALIAVILLGFIDYLTGTEIPMGVFYSMPVWTMTWFVGPRPALIVGTVGIGAWLVADHFAGFHYSHPWYLILNGATRFAFYLFMVAIITELRNLQDNLEALAESRAQDLASEAARNVRLEREVLEVGEREHRRIGQDLHDGLCQHLTGTAMAGQVLAERLPESAPMRADARRVVALIEDGIALARGIARGLYPIEGQGEGLMQSLESFTTNTSELFGIQCRFECPMPVLIENPNTASHLYRIAQEAVSNAIRHGHATEIEVILEVSDAGIRLRVTDNGVGLPDPLPDQKRGMGLRTMADRAGSIGGQLSIHPGLVGGAEVICNAPVRWLA